MAQRHLYERRRIRRIRRVRHTHRRTDTRRFRQVLGVGLGVLVLVAASDAAIRTDAFGFLQADAGLRRQAVSLPTRQPDSRKRAVVPPKPRPPALPALPDGGISRAAFAVLLAARQHLALTPVGPRFTDVSAHSPAFTSVEAAADAGDFGQTPPSRFDPGMPVTRAYLTATLVNALGLGPEAALLNNRPLPGVPENGVPFRDRGAFALAFALGLVRPIGGRADLSARATLAEVSDALTAWPTLPSSALGRVLGHEVTSITLRVSPTTVWPGEPVSVSTQVHVGELTVPVRPEISTVGGTLAGGVFLPSPGSHTARISVTVPGSAVHAAEPVHVVTATAVNVLGPEPIYVLPGTAATFHLGVVGPAHRPVSIDNGRRLSVTVMGPTGVLSHQTVTDHAGLASYTFTPTLLGADHIQVSAPGLRPANLGFSVVPGALGTVSLLTGHDSLSVGQGLSLGALWTSLGKDPKLTRPVPLQLTATLTPNGSRSGITLDSWAVSLPPHAASSSVRLPAIAPVTEPGTLTVSLGAPGGAVDPSVITLPVLPPGSLRMSPPEGARVGTPVHITANVVGSAPRGARAELSLIAPDGGPLSPIGGSIAGHRLEFVFIPRETGVYRARVSLPGDGTVSAAVPVSAGPPVRLSALLPSPFVTPGQSLGLTPFALDAAGQPVSGPVIHVRWRLLGGLVPTVPGRKGSGSQGASSSAQTASRRPTGRAETNRSLNGGIFSWHIDTLPSGQVLALGTLPATALAHGHPHGIQVELTAAGLPSVRTTVPLIPTVRVASLAEGTGVFLSYWVARDESAQSLVRHALLDHVHTLLVEASVPGTGFWGQPGLDRLLPVAHKAGLSVLAWVPANLAHPSHDLAVARAVLAYRTPLGQQVDGIACDFEGNLSPSVVTPYLDAVRKAAGPGRVVAAIEAAPPTDAQIDPVLGRLANVLMPMDYWQMNEAPSTYASAYQEVATSVQFLRLATPAAVVPILQGYDPFSPGGAGLYNPGPLAERGALRAAFSNGGAGAAFFQWGSLTPAEWQMVDRASPGVPAH